MIAQDKRQEKVSLVETPIYNRLLYMNVNDLLRIRIKNSHDCSIVYVPLKGTQPTYIEMEFGCRVMDSRNR